MITYSLSNLMGAGGIYQVFIDIFPVFVTAGSF